MQVFGKRLRLPIGEGAEVLFFPAIEHHGSSGFERIMIGEKCGKQEETPFYIPMQTGSRLNASENVRSDNEQEIGC